MLYRKNIYQWEQWSRVLIGGAATVWGVLFAPAQPLGYGVAAVGLAVAITGIVGWCPACAMVGRRIRERQ